jgi:hypothetical protein
VHNEQDAISECFYRESIFVYSAGYGFLATREWHLSGLICSFARGEKGKKRGCSGDHVDGVAAQLPLPCAGGLLCLSLGGVDPFSGLLFFCFGDSQSFPGRVCLGLCLVGVLGLLLLVGLGFTYPLRGVPSG